MESTLLQRYFSSLKVHSNVRLILDCINGIRNYHQFDANKSGSISCRPVSQSNDETVYTFKLESTVPSTVNRIPTVHDFVNGFFLIIEHEDIFRVAQIKSSDLTTAQMTVSCFDPPFPASSFNSSKSPDLCNLVVSTDHFRARLIDNPQRLANGNIRISSQQFLDIQNIWEEE